jgi:sortase A
MRRATPTRSSAWAVAAALVFLVACGHDGRAGAPVATPAASTGTATTEADNPILGTIPDSTVATTSPATTAAGTAPVTSVSLPVPQPPPDPHAPEPYQPIGTIKIPKIGLERPLLEGVSLTTLDRGPGHWPGSALPGQLGNVVVAGHRTSHDHPFRYIDQLVPGDEVILSTLQGRYVYVVTGSEVVTPAQMGIIGQTAAYTATLFACTPPGSTKYRLVVHLTLRQP